MDKRFIFRYRSRTIRSPGAGWGRSSAALELPRLSLQSPSGSPGVVRGVGNPEGNDGYSIEPCLQEKPGNECRERPYRKPTLVAGCESTKVDG